VPSELPSDLPPEPSVPELSPPEALPFFKRMLARLMGRGLTGMSAQHTLSWMQGHTDGYLNGHAEGMNEGYAEGHFDGLEEGRQVLLIRDTRPSEHRGPRTNDHLFDDWRLPLTAELKKQVRLMSL